MSDHACKMFADRQLCPDFPLWIKEIVFVLTILSFAAIFAGLGAGAASERVGTAVLLVLGVLLGSALWWVILTGVVSLARSRITLRVLRWINWLSGVVLLMFGAVALIGLR